MKRVVPGLLLTVALVCGHCFAASHDAAVSGVVRDVHGTPQMGALVQLLSPDATAIATAFTDDHGRYLMPSVVPGKYHLRATAAFLVPATRPNIHLQAGAQAIVNLTMTALFEAENWLPAQKRRADEPADDWKWTLRSAASRPLLRMVDPSAGIQMSSSAETTKHATSQVRMQVTSGDGAFAQGGVHQVLVVNSSLEDGDGAIFRADMGSPMPGYPLEKSIEASAGYERRLPFGGSTRLVSSYQAHPELTYGAGTGVQVLRLSSTQEMHLGDAVVVDVGTLMQAERLAATHMTTAPFVRVEVRPISGTVVEYRYASSRDLQSSEDLDRVKPRNDVLTDAAGHPLRAETGHHEVAVNHKFGDRTVALAAYSDRFQNAAIAGSGDVNPSVLSAAELITDSTTETFRLRTAGYSARGMSLSMVQPITPSLAAWMEYDLGTALMSDGKTPMLLNDVRSSVTPHTTHAASVALRGKVLRTGTAMRAEYRWQPNRTLTQVNAYNAGPDEAFLSLYIRQRVWCGRFLPEGIDAVVEATNLLEQGYQPVLAPDGHTLYLAQIPRAIQAGLAFNF